MDNVKTLSRFATGLSMFCLFSTLLLKSTDALPSHNGTNLANENSNSDAHQIFSQHVEPIGLNSNNFPPQRLLIFTKTPRITIHLDQPRGQKTLQTDNMLFSNPLSKIPRVELQQKQKINQSRIFIAGSGVTVANIYLYQRFKDIWWSHNRTGFHFYRGWKRTEGWWDMGPHDSLWFHMDKLGHMYNARLISKAISDLGVWVGMPRNQSAWAGALLSSMFYLEIEIFDGHYEEWGFSLGDFLASETGAFLPLLQERFPQMKNFTLKWSYHSSAEIAKQKYLIEDYAGMTFWLSADVWRILPHDLRNYWPSWLNLALGYGISKKAHGEIELYLAFDYDLTKIPARNATIRKMLEYLNYIHLPAPTLQFRPMVKNHWMYF